MYYTKNIFLCACVYFLGSLEYILFNKLNFATLKYRFHPKNYLILHVNCSFSLHFIRLCYVKIIV